MLQARHAQEDQRAAKEKAAAVAAKFREMKVKEAAKKAEDSIPEALTYMDFHYATGRSCAVATLIERLK